MITLICGHPRAGKTTYSEHFDNVIHLDNCGSYNNVMTKVGRITGDVVVEGVFYQPRHRVALLNAYKGNGSRCICLDTPKEIREKRHGYKLKRDYPFLIPTLDEGWDEIIIIRGEHEQYICR